MYSSVCDVMKCNASCDGRGQVHFILDEIVMGGMVLETNIAEILTAVGDMQKLEQATRSAPVKP